MSFRSMKALVLVLLYMIIGFGSASAASFYTWGGSLSVGQSVYLNDLTLTVDQDNTTGQLALIIESSGRVLGLLKPNQSNEFQGLNIGFKEFNGYGIVDISSEKSFSVSFNTTEDYPKQIEDLKQQNARLKSENEKLSKQVQSLQAENKKLKAQVDSLKKENAQLKEKLKGQPNTAALNARLVNLTKENRELKAELANITTKYNALKAKSDFLSQQNDEYRTMIQNLLKETAQGSTENYIQKAKKERLIGSVLLKSILLAGVVVGLVGYGFYRVKRRHEFAGL